MCIMVVSGAMISGAQFQTLERSCKGNLKFLMVFQDEHLLLLLLFKDTVVVYDLSHIPVFAFLRSWAEKLLRPFEPSPSVVLWMCTH